MGSFQTRDRTHVPSIGRCILNHWTTREVQRNFYMHWKTRRLSVTCFTVILALVQRPGINATVAPRYACKYTSCDSVGNVCRALFFGVWLQDWLGVAWQLSWRIAQSCRLSLFGFVLPSSVLFFHYVEEMKRGASRSQSLEPVVRGLMQWRGMKDFWNGLKFFKFSFDGL